MGPYKHKFLREFNKYLNFINSKYSLPFSQRKTVLDAACAYSKFTHLFEDDFFVGIDFNRDAIEFSRKKYPDQNFLFLDLTKDKIPRPVDLGRHELGYDIVITTHTLSHIDSKFHNQVINKLVDVTNEDGFMIFHINTIYSKTINHIDSKALILKKVYYRGWISDVMEKNFTNSFHGSLFGVLLNNLLSYIDFGDRDCVMLCKPRKNT